MAMPKLCVVCGTTGEKGVFVRSIYLYTYYQYLTVVSSKYSPYFLTSPESYVRRGKLFEVAELFLMKKRGPVYQYLNSGGIKRKDGGVVVVVVGNVGVDVEYAALLVLLTFYFNYART